MDDVKGLCEELRDIARRGCGIHCSIEGEFSACDEAAAALTAAEARIKALSEALAAADAIRVAQRRYMADRGNEELGRAVGAAVAVFDDIRARALTQETSNDG